MNVLERLDRVYDELMEAETLVTDRTLRRELCAAMDSVAEVMSDIIIDGKV